MSPTSLFIYVFIVKHSFFGRESARNVTLIPLVPIEGHFPLKGILFHKLLEKIKSKNDLGCLLTLKYLHFSDAIWGKVVSLW